MKITVETTVDAAPAEVWRAWTTPADIKQWNAASEDRHTTEAEVDLRVGGAFRSRMEAKDGSMGFDFSGTFSEVVPERRIAYALEDGREVVVAFEARDGGTHVRETFDADETHLADQQRAGWQAILDDFRRHVEGTVAR